VKARFASTANVFEPVEIARLVAEVARKLPDTETDSG
jgi:hypothetical protein